MNELIKAIQNERRWSKKVLLILEFHESKCAQFDNIRNIKWTIVKTASVLDMSVGAVSESLALARFLPNCEGYEKISRDEALKKMRNGKRVSGLRVRRRIKL